MSTSQASPTSIEGSFARPGLVPAAGISLPVTVHVPVLVLVPGVDCGGAPAVCGVGVVGAHDPIVDAASATSTSLRKGSTPIIARRPV